MINPVLTVIVPMYNASGFIQETIDSIELQVFRGFCVIILDDASTDDSAELVRETIKNKRNFRLVGNQSNQGYLKSTNILFSLVNTEYCAFWDADDLCDPRRFEKQIKFLSYNLDYDLVGSNCNLINEKSKFIRAVKYPVYVDENNPAICGSSITFRSSLLSKIGFYNPLFDRIGSEDFEWVGRALKVTKYYCIQEPLYFYRRLPNSLTLNLNVNASPFSISHHLAKNLLLRFSNILSDHYWDYPEVISFFNGECNRLLDIETHNPVNSLMRTLENKIVCNQIYFFYVELLAYLKKHWHHAPYLLILKFNLKLFIGIIRRSLDYDAGA